MHQIISLGCLLLIAPSAMGFGFGGSSCGCAAQPPPPPPCLPAPVCPNPAPCPGSCPAPAPCAPAPACPPPPPPPQAFCPPPPACPVCQAQAPPACPPPPPPPPPCPAPPPPCPQAQTSCARTPPAQNDCCSSCSQPCKYKTRRALGAAIKRLNRTQEDQVEVEKEGEDAVCNSPYLKAIMINNMSGSTSESKRAIQKSAEIKYEKKFDVICAKGEFSYVAHSNLFCQTTLGDITCYAFEH